MQSSPSQTSFFTSASVAGFSSTASGEYSFAYAAAIAVHASRHDATTLPLTSSLASTAGHLDLPSSLAWAALVGASAFERAKYIWADAASPSDSEMSPSLNQIEARSFLSLVPRADLSRSTRAALKSRARSFAYPRSDSARGSSGRAARASSKPLIAAG